MFLFAFFVSFYAHAANPTVKTDWKYYNIKGETVAELKKQMKRKGPRGFWAYARWNVKWTGKCKVTVKIKYVFPKWQNKSDGSAELQRDWDKMTRALKQHEEVHGSHGVNAGKELVKKSCKNGNAITRKWAKQDKIFDRRTKHGILEGVVLP